MDKQKLKQKFEEVYAKRIEPHLLVLEAEREELNKKVKTYSIILLIITAAAFLLLPIPQDNKLTVCILLLLFGMAGIYGMFAYPFRKKIKSKLLTAILGVFGKFYLVQQDLITLEDIKKYQLYPRANQKTNDDVIAGLYKGLDIYIQESKLTHQEGCGKSRRTVTDFSGIIVKIKMKKNFNGITIVRNESQGKGVKNKLQKVELEDPEFKELYNVFSDDQIEARYLLTTAFMQRLKNLREVFVLKKDGMKSSLPDIDCIFNEGYIILAVQTFEDFFEVGNIFESMLNKEIYEKVFYQMVAVFDTIHSLKLEENIGM